MNDTPACPSCARTMTRLRLPRKSAGELSLDLCFSCQGLWFDSFESTQISAAGLLELFRLIHAHAGDPRRTLPVTLRCPRCTDALQPCLDRVRSGAFTYHRCPQDHGRFTVFTQFMIEKGFVRQLAAGEVKALAARIGTVHCTGCGAPVDIRTQAVCPHCRSPIAILDPAAVEKALAETQHMAAAPQGDPERLAEALLAAERQRQEDRAGKDPSPVGDLFLAGLAIALGLILR